MMEAFTIFMLKFLERKTKVLLCLKIEKQNKAERERRIFVEIFKEKDNGMKDGMKTGGVGKRVRF